jgi:hypothetical protein
MENILNGLIGLRITFEQYLFCHLNSFHLIQTKSLVDNYRKDIKHEFNTETFKNVLKNAWMEHTLRICLEKKITKKNKKIINFVSLI